MTACKDSLSGKKAVSATLAGVLAVGMVPAAAFAETAQADTAEGQGIELQAQVTNQDLWAKATVKSMVDNNGFAVDLTKGAIAFDSNNKAHGLAPQSVEVTFPDGTTETVSTTDTSKYVVTYWQRDTDKTEVAVKGNDLSGAPTAAGAYVAKLTVSDAKSKFNGGDLLIPFDIKATSLAGATLFQNTGKANDFSDTTFTYTGSALAKEETAEGTVAAGNKGKLGVVLNGKDITADVTVTLHKKGDKTDATEATVKDAGEYYAYVVQGTEKVEIPFTVEALDLSKVSFDTIVQTEANSHAPLNTDLKVGGEALELAGTEHGDATAEPAVPAGENELTIEQVQGGSFGDAGTYEFTVKAASNNKNVVNTGKVTVDIAKADVSSAIFYGTSTTAFGTEYAKAANKTINHSNGDADFDASKIKVYAKTSGYTKKDLLPTSKYTVKVYDEKGNEVSSWTAAGTYKAVVTVSDSEHKYCGTQTGHFTVTEGTVATKSVSVMYDGALVSDTTQASPKQVDYTGEDVLSQLKVKVTDADDNELVEGTDFTLKAEKVGGTEVDSIVNADTYKVTIDAPGYTFETSTDAEVYIKVNTINVAPFISNTADDAHTWLAYTGSDIKPVVKYDTGKKDAKGKAVYAELPSDVYTLTYTYNKKSASSSDFKAVDSIKDMGYYKVSIVLNDTEAAKNFQLTETTLPVQVKDERTFADVPAGAWFADVVSECAKAGYMTGYADTNMFGPYDELTRAQSATVLFKMAGGVMANEGSTTSLIGYNTPFSDVDKGAWYAQPIQWAAATGVVKGYGDGTFGPDQKITREQFAVMLYNYAKQTSNVEAFDVDATLAGVSDGASVSEWAREAVAWAVSNKIMGVNSPVNPAADITRAEAAAMLTRFAPYEAPAVTYTVSFDANTTADVAGSVASKTVVPGGKVILPAAAAYVAKDFEQTGWEVNGKAEAFGAEITVNADTVVKAVWEAKAATNN